MQIQGESGEVKQRISLMLILSMLNNRACFVLCFCIPILELSLDIRILIPIQNQTPTE